MENRKVEVVSLVDYMVGIHIDDIHFHRQFAAKNEPKKIDYDILNEGLNLPGIRTLFKEAILYIPNKKDRIDLGLESDEPEDEIVILNKGQMIKALKIDTAEQFRQTMQKLPKEQRRAIAELAVTEKYTDYAKCEIIKEFTGMDVLASVADLAVE